MIEASLFVFNFALGVGVFFSPCGVPMLPAFVSYYLTREGERRATPGVAIAGGLVVALGAALTLSGIALGALAIGRAFKAQVIHLELLGGLLVLALGIATLLGKAPSFAIRAKAGTTRGFSGLFAFGALYAAVAAGCAAGPFITVILQAVAFPLADGMLAIGAYAAGFVGLLVVATIAVALLGAAVAKPLFRHLPKIQRAGGVVMIAVGAYVLYYWYAAITVA